MSYEGEINEMFKFEIEEDLGLEKLCDSGISN